MKALCAWVRQLWPFCKSVGVPASTPCKPAGPHGPRPTAVELRIHGTGGSSAADLLDVSSERHVVRVADGPTSAFHARRDDRNVEGYVWGRLTSLAPLQPLWLFLLPFTFLNVAGFMHRKSHGKLTERGIRHVILSIGYTLTASWALWASVVCIDQLAFQWLAKNPDLVANVVIALRAAILIIPIIWMLRSSGMGDGSGGALLRLGASSEPTRGGRIALALTILLGALGLGIVVYVFKLDKDSADSALLLGGLLALVLFGALFAIARHATEDFEEVRPPRLGQEGKEVDPPIEQAFARLPRFSLTDREMWEQYSQNPSMQRKVAWHSLVGVSVIVGMFLWASAITSPPDQLLKLGRAIPLLVAIQLLLLLLLGLVSLWEGFSNPVGRRWAGPFAAAATGVGLLHTTFSGLSLGISKWLDAGGAVRGNPSKPSKLVAPEQVMSDVLGAAALAAAVTIVLWLLFYLYFAKVEDVPPLDAPHHPGCELRSLPNNESRYAVLTARRLGRANEYIGLLLMVPSLVFLTYGALKVGGRLWLSYEKRVRPWWDTEVWVNPCGKVWEWLWSPCGGPDLDPTWLTNVGVGLVAGALPLGLAFIWRAARSEKTRRLVGNLWDVLTFWPRWHHPFAVRPYSERAVPELQHRLVHHTGSHHPVVISAHSQGSVLAAAALLSLEKQVTEKVALVTYGSPLTQLHARFFPAYFLEARQTLYDVVRKRWKSFYRLTDYIGKGIGRGIGIDDPLNAVDNPALEDPPIRPSASEIEPGAPLEASELEPFTRLNRHSHYRREKVVQDQVVFFRKELAKDAEGPDEDA
jgi:hypothetical protein